MNSSATDATTLAIESPPKSCLELLTILRRLEALVDARIRWHAESPPTVGPNRGIRFPVVVYDGPTQTRKKSLLAEHRARRAAFKELEQTLPPLFKDLGLPEPEGSEFQIPQLARRKKKSVDSDDGKRFRQASEYAQDFWGKLAASVQAEAFNRNELLSSWTPVFSNWHLVGEPPANRKVYPPFPIRSLIDMEKWLGLWIERCTLPERPASSDVRRATDPNAVSVTVKVPSTPPPFRSPVEEVWRCQVDGLVRELRNCRRTFHAWGLPIDTDWVGDPPDCSTAEDRLVATTNRLRKYRQAAMEKLGTWHSDAQIGRMPVPELLSKMATASTDPARRTGGGEKSPPTATSGKTGRPKGKNVSDPKVDKQIYDLWMKGHFISKSEFANNLPSSLSDLDLQNVAAAIDRHRKRLAKLGKN